jgi:sporulation protein YlmC with PRC-barrel domain
MQAHLRIGTIFVVLIFSSPLMAQTKMPSAAEPITGTFLSVQASNQWLATKLVGLPVYGVQNEKIGSINDLVIDQSGAIQAVVIGVGGFLGIAAKDIAVSLKTINIIRDANEEKAVVELTKPEIELAPAFQHYVKQPVEALPPTSPKPQ